MEAGEAGVPLLTELGSGRDAGAAGDEPGRGREPEGAGAGEAPGADRGTRPLRSRCASDRRGPSRPELEDLEPDPKS